MKPESHIASTEYEHQHPVLANPCETRAMDHLPQLDGVRAIAVLLVLWWHFMPKTVKEGGSAPWGAIGVGLFFTLSGFLITRILLNCKYKIESGKSSVGSMMKQFYMRRFLRIFPLYYGVLLVLGIFNVTGIRERIGWHLLYLSNVRFSYWQKSGEIERHLWSLSVEEQFYLIWPLLIFLVPRRWLVHVIVLTVIAAPIWRVLTYTPRLFGHEWMMPGCLDLLGLGALLALFSLPQFGWSRWWNALVDTCGLVGVPLFVVYVTCKSLSVQSVAGATETVNFLGHQSIETVGRTGWMGMGFNWPGGETYPITALMAVWLIGSASRGFRGILGYALSSAPLVYIGRISYGLYVLHMLVPHAVHHFFPGWAWAKAGDWRALVAFTGISIALASLSWHLYEAPLNRLKRYFEYDRTARAKEATSA